MFIKYGECILIKLSTASLGDIFIAVGSLRYYRLNAHQGISMRLAHNVVSLTPHALLELLDGSSRIKKPGLTSLDNAGGSRRCGIRNAD